MMFHPALKDLRAFAGNQLSAAGRADTARHMAKCQRCRDHVSWIESVQSALQNAPVFAAPEAVWTRVQKRIDRGDVVLLPRHDAPAVVRVRRRAIAAAVLVFTLAGSAAALMVRNPVVREWLNALTNDGKDLGGVVAPAPTLPVAPSPEPYTAEVAVPPSDGALSLTILKPDSALQLRVRIGDQPDMEVRAIGLAGQAAFRTGAGRLTVDQPGEGVLLVSLPRSVRHALVSVDGRGILMKDGAEVRLMVRADTSGPEFILPVR